MSKRLTEWTLGEVIKHCKKTPCSICPFCAEECVLGEHTPNMWPLHKFNNLDIESARMLINLFGQDTAPVKRYEDGTLTYCGIGLMPELFPGIAPGEEYTLKEIIQEE